MFSSYDLTNFSKKLKSIRNAIGVSQQEVSDKTGINSDTLRRLENGMSIPRFDTLEVLSQFYKVNLMGLLDSYKKSSELSYFYNQIDHHMVNENFEELSKTINLFEDFTKSNQLKMVEPKEVEQLRLFFSALELSYQNLVDSNLKAINLLEKALCLSNPLFVLSNWHQFKYNYLELRILLTIASLEGINRNCELSNEITLYILNYLDSSSLSKFNEKLLIIKSYCVISYNYHRLDQHDQAHYYSEIGIKFCIEHAILSYLHFLLFRKGIALYHLNDKNYIQFIDQSIQLLKIQGKFSVAQTYEEYKSKIKPA